MTTHCELLKSLRKGLEDAHQKTPEGAAAAKQIRRWVKRHWLDCGKEILNELNKMHPETYGVTIKIKGVKDVKVGLGDEVSVKDIKNNLEKDYKIPAKEIEVWAPHGLHPLADTTTMDEVFTDRPSNEYYLIVSPTPNASWRRR